MEISLPKIFKVSAHTDHIGKGSTFVAIKGTHTNGANYIPLALEKGATTIVIEMDETDKVARYSACFVLNANVINGIPKKAKLPKIVLIVNR